MNTKPVYNFSLSHSTLSFPLIIPHMHLNVKERWYVYRKDIVGYYAKIRKYRIFNILFSPWKSIFYLVYKPQKENLLLLATTYFSTASLKPFYGFLLFHLVWAENSFSFPLDTNLTCTTLNITFYCHGKHFLLLSFAFQSPKICMVYERFW